MRKLILALAAALAAATPANATCTVGKLLELKVTMQGQQPLTDLVINGRSLQFVVDSGAFFSTISPGTAAELGLRLAPAPVQMEGIGGAAGMTYLTNVKSLDISGVALRDIQFIVGGSEVGVGGLLGQNVLGIADAEYDLGHGSIRLMRSRGCSANDNLAYWSGQRPVSDLAIDPRDESHPHTIGAIRVNGATVRAVFDTGAGGSILSLAAAKRAGITTSSPGVVPAGTTRGLGRSMIQTWIAPVGSVEIGTERLLNMKVRIGDIGIPDADMLIGADFFLSHHVYVANTSRRMYFTYDGGPVFNEKPSMVLDQSGAPETIAADSGPAPTDAEGFSRRGAAEIARRDYQTALDDLDRAVAMDPANGRYLLERARAKILLGNRAGAFADLDQAVKVAPADPQVRLARTESLLARKRPSDAASDLQAVDAALPRQSDQRFQVAAIWGQLDQFDKAIADYDLWIAAHPDDSRQPLALNGRCWVRALAGRELPLALKDCDSAIRRSKSASFYDSRGLVELRMGQYDRAIADYDAALQLSPNTAWSLYGRGLAKRHKGDASSQADLNAAAAIDSSLPTRAHALGIS